MLTQSILCFSLWVIIWTVSGEIFLSRLFNIQKDTILVLTSTTRDFRETSLSSCAYLCLATTGCCAASFAYNSTCRIEMSETCNFTMLPSVGDTSIMSQSGGSTQQNDFIGTNSHSPSNQTAVFGQDGTTHEWSFDSTETTNNTSFTTMQISKNRSPTDVVSQGFVTMDTQPTDPTFRDHVTTDTAPTDIISRHPITSNISTTDATSRGNGTTNTPTTDMTSSVHKTYSSTKMTSRNHVTTETKSTDTTTHTSVVKISEKPLYTTEQLSEFSFNYTTTDVNRWPHATTNYMFLDTLSLPMFEAKAYCNDIGGKLLEIETAEKDQLLQDNLLYSASLFYWLGGYDNIGDGNFAWLSNPTEPIVYTNWNIQEPRKTGTNLCLRGGANWSFKWGSALCTEPYPFFCEKLP